MSASAWMEKGTVLFYRFVRKHGCVHQFVRLNSGRRISRADFGRKTAPGHKVYVQCWDVS